MRCHVIKIIHDAVKMDSLCCCVCEGSYESHFCICCKKLATCFAVKVVGKDTGHLLYVHYVRSKEGNAGNDTGVNFRTKSRLRIAFIDFRTP